MKAVARSGWTRLTLDVMILCGLVICAAYFIGIDAAGADMSDPFVITYDFLP